MNDDAVRRNTDVKEVEPTINMLQRKGTFKTNVEELQSAAFAMQNIFFLPIVVANRRNGHINVLVKTVTHFSNPGT